MAEISSYRRRSWPAVASAFAVILLFITLVGLKALSYAEQIGVEIQNIQQEQEESDQILDELRADTYAVAIELRDYFEASPAESEAARRRFFQIEQRMNADATLLEAKLGSQMNRPVQRLRRGLKRYSLSIAPIFKWTPKERQAHGGRFNQCISSRRTAYLRRMYANAGGRSLPHTV